MDLLDRQFEELQRLYPDARIIRHPDGVATVSLPTFPLPAGWNASSIDVHFLVPLGYPMARPDCFWTGIGLCLATGAPPSNTGQNNSHRLEEPKLWFSYHPASWTPNADTLLTYTRVIDQRLRMVQ